MKLLFVGDIHYHEKNIVLPMVEALGRAGVEVVRAGERVWHYPPGEYRPSKDTWYKQPHIFEGVGGILFLDMASADIAPVYFEHLLKTTAIRPMFNIFHGSSFMPEDSYAHLPGAQEYERFMFSVLKGLLVPAAWILEYLPQEPDYTRSYRVFGFPIEYQLAHLHPRREPATRVIFNSRWCYDKGRDRFEEFARLASRANIDCLATGEGTHPDIHFLGWQPQDSIYRLAERGGYVFGASRQETWGYSALDLLAAGMHPLFHDNENYSQLGMPDSHCFRTYDEAVQIVLEGRELDETYWNTFVSENRDNSDKLADYLKGAAHG